MQETKWKRYFYYQMVFTILFFFGCVGFIYTTVDSSNKYVEALEKNGVMAEQIKVDANLISELEKELESRSQ